MAETAPVMGSTEPVNRLAYRALFSPGHKINARSVSLRNWQRSMRGSHSCSRSFKPKTEYGMSVENSWRRYLCPDQG